MMLVILAAALAVIGVLVLHAPTPAPVREGRLPGVPGIKRPAERATRTSGVQTYVQGLHPD